MRLRWRAIDVSHARRSLRRHELERALDLISPADAQPVRVDFVDLASVRPMRCAGDDPDDRRAGAARRRPARSLTVPVLEDHARAAVHERPRAVAIATARDSSARLVCLAARSQISVRQALSRSRYGRVRARRSSQCARQSRRTRVTCVVVRRRRDVDAVTPRLTPVTPTTSSTRCCLARSGGTTSARRCRMRRRRCSVPRRGTGRRRARSARRRTELAWARTCRSAPCRSVASRLLEPEGRRSSSRRKAPQRVMSWIVPATRADDSSATRALRLAAAATAATSRSAGRTIIAVRQRTGR